MTEQDSPSKRFKDRVTNLNMEGMFQELMRGKDANTVTLRTLPDDGSSDYVFETFYRTERLRVASDIAWISALLDSGINIKTILKIWDLKDETFRKQKEMETLMYIYVEMSSPNSQENKSS